MLTNRGRTAVATFGDHARIMLLLSRWLGLFVLAVIAAAQQPGSLVVQVQGEARAVDLASGAVGKVTGEVPRQPPPLQRRLHGMDYASIPTKAVWSPDGKRVAHVLRTFETAAANGEIAITDADGGNLVVVTEDGGDNQDPWWSPDGKRLLFRGRARKPRRVGLRAFQLADGSTVELGDERLLLSPRPVLLADGFLLAVHKKPYELPPGVSHARPKFRYHLVVDPCVEGREPEIVQPDVPMPIALEVSANGLVVWLAAEDVLLRIDRRSKQVTHRWHIAELGDAEWPVRLGQLAVHPDGDQAAVTFWGLGWKDGKEGGRDVVALVEVPGAKAPKDAVPSIRRIVVGPDPRLLGFTSATQADSAAKPATEPR